MPSLPKRALIIGPGGVGSVLGRELRRAGFKVTFMGRQGPKAHDFHLETESGTETFDSPTPGQAELSSALVFVTVKAFDLAAALKSHLPLLEPEATVICLGNGFIERELEEAAEQFPQMKFRLGVATFGVTEMGPRHFSLRARGQFRWGAFRPAADQPTELENFALRESNVFTWLEDAREAARQKWLFNTVLNSVSAAYRLPSNGSALLAPRLRLVFREAYQLGRELWGPWSLSEEGLFQKMVTLVQATSQNENSAAQAVRLGRPTETDFLAGLARDREEYPELRQLDATLRNRSAPTK